VQRQQVRLNLILNRIEAMSRIDVPRRELTISTHVHQDAGIWVQVRDTGEGFDPGFVDQMVNAFQATKKGGLGVGFRSVVRWWKTTVGSSGQQLTKPREPAFTSPFSMTFTGQRAVSVYPLFQGSETDNTKV
jgi:sensor histidine kinase regulating citrate/malate metabolism